MKIKQNPLEAHQTVCVFPVSSHHAAVRSCSPENIVLLALQKLLQCSLFSVRLPSFHPEMCEDFFLMMRFTLQLCDILLLVLIVY